VTLRFASPWLLLLLAVPPVLLSLPYLIKRWFKPAALRYSDTSRLDDLPVSARQTLRPLLPLLRLAGMLLVILALARPQSGQTHQVVEGEGVDIVLALDISGSMAALDYEPLTRLETAKQVTAQFIEARRYDRIGLVVFASSTFHQSPPTADHTVLLRLLDEVELSSDLGIEDGTALGMGLANAASMLKDSSSQSKVIILLTDGVNNTGPIDPLTAAQAAQALGMRVYTIGMGRPGLVPVPVRDDFGNEQIVYQESELDEEMLRAIAGVTGGRYYRTQDQAALEQIYAEIDTLEKSHYEVTSTTRYRELAVWFLLPGILLLVLDFVLQRTVFRVIP
jgi:Ca-activated chloride channel family protein